MRGAVASLFHQRVQLVSQRLLALTQQRHPLAQLLERYQFLLVGGEQPLDGLPDAREVPLHRLRAGPIERHYKPAVRRGGTLVGSAAWAVSSQRSGSFWIKAGSSSNRS